MQKFTYTIDMVTDNMDMDSFVSSLRDYLAENHSDVVSQVKSSGVKSFSEQGFKVWRARTTGVTAKQAGDAHNPKASKAVTETVES